jgi:poly(3-hydroxybutyrate) depolymerase
VVSDKKNQIVWPTAKDTEPKQKFKTEQFIEAVVKDVKAKQKIDENKVFALGWSSGGPAVYASALQKDSPLAGAFVAMSVFVPAKLPPLVNAKGRNSSSSSRRRTRSPNTSSRRWRRTSSVKPVRPSR